MNLFNKKKLTVFSIIIVIVLSTVLGRSLFVIKPDTKVLTPESEIEFYRAGSYPKRIKQYLSYIDTKNLWKSRKITFKYPKKNETCKSYKSNGCEFSGSLTLKKSQVPHGAYI